jgi:hypothetical protein
MSSAMPPVPPENRSSKGPGDAGAPPADEGAKGAHGAPDPDRQGQQGNSKVNTTHQGYQQDR